MIYTINELSNKKYLSKLNIDYNIVKPQDYNWEFYVNNQRFDGYRSQASQELQPMIKCKEYKNNIYMIWMNNTDNIPFINYSKWFYKKLFDWCNLNFN